MSKSQPREKWQQGQLPVARHGRLKRPSALVTVLKYFAAVLAVVVVSTGTVTAVAVLNVATSLNPGVALVGETAGPPPGVGAYEGVVNFLLVGSDSGGGDPQYGTREGERNDVTILLHISADRTNATVVSFPRDMFVPIPACPRSDGNGNHSAMSSQKLNVSLSYGGLACTVLTVSQLTELDIPFAATIEMNGVIGMSNAIGGVDVCVATAIHDNQIHLHLDSGMHSLQGKEAQLFLQSRYGVGDGSDLGRISNQQVFLSALVRKMKSAQTLSDPLKVYGLAKVVAGNMELSNSLQNLNTMVSIAAALKNIAPENINFVQYPTVYGSSGTQSGVFPIQRAANELMAAIKADQPVRVTGTTGVGSELNPEATTPGDSEATGSPAPSAPPVDTTVELPSTIHGQSAAEETCSKGQTAGG